MNCSIHQYLQCAVSIINSILASLHLHHRQCSPCWAIGKKSFGVLNPTLKTLVCYPMPQSLTGVDLGGQGFWSEAFQRHAEKNSSIFETQHDRLHVSIYVVLYIKYSMYASIQYNCTGPLQACFIRNTAGHTLLSPSKCILSSVICCYISCI